MFREKPRRVEVSVRLAFARLRGLILLAIHRLPFYFPADLLSSSSLRMGRQGFPAATTPGGTSRVTTLPAPMVECKFAPLFSLRRIQGMGGGVNLHLGAEQYAIAQANLVALENHAIVVDVKALAGEDIKTIVPGNAVV